MFVVPVIQYPIVSQINTSPLYTRNNNSSVFFATALIGVRAGKFIVMKEYDFTHAVVVETIVFVGLCHTSIFAVDTPSKSTNDVNVTDVDVLLMCIPIKRNSKLLLQKKTPHRFDEGLLSTNTLCRVVKIKPLKRG
jgi:hypothetical protein